MYVILKLQSDRAASTCSTVTALCYTLFSAIEIVTPMNLSPLLESELIVIGHTLTAVLAIVLGGLQLAMKKGTALHRILGRLWVVIMAAVALSSFGIHHFKMFGPFSVIHLLSLLVLFSLWQGISAIRKGDVKKHKTTMVQLYVLALLITGIFTFAPGRVVYRMFFG